MSTPTHATPVTLSITTQKLDTTAQYQALIDGIQADLAGMDPFVLRGRTISRTDLLAVLAKVISAAAKTKADRLALAASLAEEQAALQAAGPLRKSMKALFVAREGEDSPKVQKYGFVQNRAPRKRSTAKAAGVAKAKATRTANGIKGRQQRAAIAATPPSAASGDAK